MNKFYKGRTNNHLTWVMVDATDFATPESALSAATTIKIYGKVRGATGVNFVSSGTGSLTNDIQHVGASATGIYTIALAKADLSDASNAWYDQYVITLSGTGAARQTLVVDGGIDDSEVLSQLLVALSAASDAASAAQQANSRVLLVQSRLSDFNSVYTSDISDVKSMLTALSDALSDAHSDLRSYLVGMSGMLSDTHSMATALSGPISDLTSALSDAHSDLKSAIGGVTATVGASDISDIASAVWAHAVGTRVDSRVLLTQSLASDALSAANVGNSRILLVQSRLSDFDSRMVSDISDIRSALSDAHSDLKSAIGGVTATVGASDISDIASAVWAHAVGTRVDSRVLLTQSLASDAHSAAAQANSRVLLVQSLASDAHSAAILGASHASDAHSAANVGASRALLLISTLSDVKSQLTDVETIASDAHSAAVELVEAHAEPAGVPAADETVLDKIGYLFMALRNKVDVTATKKTFYDDGGAAEWEKDLSDDGATYSESEGNAP